MYENGINNLALTIDQFQIGDIIKCKNSTENINNIKFDNREVKIKILDIYKVKRNVYKEIRNSNSNNDNNNSGKILTIGNFIDSKLKRSKKGIIGNIFSKSNRNNNGSDYSYENGNNDSSNIENQKAEVIGHYLEKMYKIEVYLKESNNELCNKNINLEKYSKLATIEINEYELIDILNHPSKIIDMILNSPVLTHNCMQRLVCGQLGSVSSRMALDNMQATTIDGRHKGAGMVKAQGIISHIQYYFEETNWITDWFTSRGMTNKGYDVNEDPNATVDPSTIDLGEDEDISISEKKTIIEFDSIKKEIDNTKDQHFDEV